MKRYFRGEELIDREEEIKFFLNWFKQLPKLILWVYGPKSCGKTTLIEYVVEKKLFEDFEKLKPKGNYWVKYLNLRRKLISSYETFLNSFIFPDDKTTDENLGITINLGMIKLDYKIFNKVKEKKLDLFEVLIENFKSIEGKKILIIDEIQTLEEIYINGDRELLKEFLNFCVALSKETHIAHVVILSSNTIFIDRIYNDAKLKKTSHFYLIDHLAKSIVVEWLTSEELREKEIELIWEYLGGCIPDIQKFLREWDKKQSLEKYLEKKAFEAYTEIIDLLTNEPDKQKRQLFKLIAKEIINKGCFLINDDTDTELKDIIKEYAEKEILFLNPLTMEVTGNSRIYEKGIERLVGG